ncbi:MAG: 16S rRNA (uracil(1498)-N(3))-methyltransferase [Deltaproteobacteria bacterium]|nr:16S rRNA (uracil(1498)-N(3))-methyltransferase [Deltaproteobacteria bacterium]
MRRFFVEDITPLDSLVIIKGDEFVHLKRVLRLKIGDAASVFNGSGLELSGTVEAVEKDFAKIKIEQRIEHKNESPVHITLIQGLVKGDKPELVIQKATELGVNALFFYVAARSVVQIKDSRLARWRKVAIEAAKQCGRAIVPAIIMADGMKAALGRLASENSGALKLVFWEGADKKGVKEVLRGAHGCGSVAALVGPEGGFTEEEINDAISSGFVPAGLGPRILRSETAGVAAVAVIQYESGGMD